MIDDNLFQGCIRLLVSNFWSESEDGSPINLKHKMNKTLDFNWQWGFFNK